MTRSVSWAPAVLTQGNATEQAALDYIGRGWFVLPTQGKRPDRILAPHGLRTASSDPDRVRDWYRRGNPDAGVGVACRWSGPLGIDVDDRNGGPSIAHHGNGGGIRSRFSAMYSDGRKRER
jgi:hypothetical protein